LKYQNRGSLSGGSLTPNVASTNYVLTTNVQQSNATHWVYFNGMTFDLQSGSMQINCDRGYNGVSATKMTYNLTFVPKYAPLQQSSVTLGADNTQTPFSDNSVNEGQTASLLISPDFTMISIAQVR
jgi:hypothetical protein